MPNYVKNELTIQAKGKELEDILRFIQKDGEALGTFDFNKVIPMPEGLNLTAGSITSHSVCAFISYINAQGADVIRQHTDELLAGMQIAKGFLGGASYRMNEEQISSFAERYDMSPDAFIALGKHT